MTFAALGLAAAFGLNAIAVAQTESFVPGPPFFRGFWSDPSNWSLGYVPDLPGGADGNHTSVVIPVLSTVTQDVSTAAAFIGAVQPSMTNSGRWIINAGVNSSWIVAPITNNSRIDNSGDMEAFDATLTNAASAALNNLTGGILNVASLTTFNNSGTVNNAGSLTTSDTRMTNTGVVNNSSTWQATNATTVTNTGTINNSGVLSNGATLDNSFSFGGLGGGITRGSIINTGQVRNGEFATATITNESLAVIDNHSGFYNLLHGRFQNDGTFTNFAGGVLQNNNRVDNNGLLSNQAGAVVVNFSNADDLGFVNNGTLNNASQGAFGFAGLTNAAGAIFINAGTLSNAANLDNSGLFGNANAGVLQNSGVLSNSGSFENDATVNNDGVLDNFGTLKNFTASGRLTNSATGILNNPGTLENDSDAFLENLGTMTNTGTTNNFGEFQNRGTLANSGALVIQTSNGLVNGGTVANASNGSVFVNEGFLENVGTINNDGHLNAFNGQINNLGGVLNNSGTIELGSAIDPIGAGGSLLNSGGALFPGGVINSTGAIIVNSGATLTNGFKSTLTSTGTFTNFGAVTNGFSGDSSAVFTTSGSLVNRGAVTNFAQFTNDVGGNFENAHNFLNTNSGGGSAVFTNAGALTNDAGAIINNQARLVNSGTLINNSEGDPKTQTTIAGLLNTGTIENHAGGLIVNNGRLTSNAGGAIENAGTIQNNFVLVSNNGASVHISAGGTLVNGSATTGGLLDSEGAFTTDAGSTIVNTRNGGFNLFQNQIGGRLQNDGTISMVGIGGPIESLNVMQTGRLSGIGSVSGNVMMAGTMAPGDSPGTFQIFGAYTQTGTGFFDEEIAGLGNNDELDVTGNVFLAGTLEAELLGPFAPSLGNKFVFLRYGGSRSGIFDFSLLPALAAGLGWSIDYDDADREVLLSIISGPGSLPPPPPPPGSPVPEPGTLLLMASGLSVAIWRAGLRRSQ